MHKAPAVEPIHLTEAKLHLRLAVGASAAATYTDEDTDIAACIAASRQVAETETWRAIVLQAWDLYLDQWPADNAIELPLPPLRKVEFVKWTDSDGTETTITNYTVDTKSERGRVVLNYGESWPSGTLAPVNPIHVRFWAGYAVPFTAASSTDTITATDHPFAAGDMVQVSVSGGELPGGLAAGITYYVRDVSGATLKLAATATGDAINLTSDGTGTLFLGVVPAPVVAGMKLVIADLFENRADTETGRVAPSRLPRAATHWFAMVAAKRW